MQKKTEGAVLSFVERKKETHFSRRIKRLCKCFIAPRAPAQHACTRTHARWCPRCIIAKKSLCAQLFSAAAAATAASGIYAHAIFRYRVDEYTHLGSYFFSFWTMVVVDRSAHFASFAFLRSHVRHYAIIRSYFSGPSFILLGLYTCSHRSCHYSTSCLAHAVCVKRASECLWKAAHSRKQWEHYLRIMSTIDF